MSAFYGVFRPVSIALWCLYGISDGFVENHIFCSVTEAHHFFFVVLIIYWIYVFLGVIGGKIHSKFLDIFVQYFILFLSSLFGLALGFVWAPCLKQQEAHEMWVQEIYCHPVIFLAKMGSKACSIR